MSASPPSSHPMAPLSRSPRPSIAGPSSPAPPYPLQLHGVVTPGFGRGARQLGIPTANLPDSSLGPLNALGLTGIYFGFARVHPTVPAPGVTESRTSGAARQGEAAAGGTNGSDEPKGTTEDPLTSDSIASMQAQTAPYPPDSRPGETAAPKHLSEEDGKVWPMVMSVGWNPYFKNEKITAEVHIMHPFEHDFYGHDMSVLVLGYIRPELDYISMEALIEDINFDVKVALNSLARETYAGYATNPFLTGDLASHRPADQHTLHP